MIVPGPDNICFRFIRGTVYLWIAVLVLALDPRTEDPAAPVKLLASAVAAIFMIVVWAYAVRSGRAPYRRMNPPLWYLFFFFSLLGLFAALSASPGRAGLVLCPWAVFASIGFVIYQCFPHAVHLRNLLRAIVAAVTISSLYALAQHVGLDPFPWADRSVEEYRALPATYGNPNLAGHVLVVATVLCAGLLVDVWQRKRWSFELLVYAVPGTTIVAHLAFTQMRSGVVALGMAVLFVAIYASARRADRARTSAGAIALITCTAFLGLFSVCAILLSPWLHLDSSLQLRLNGYSGAAALLLEHPFLGIGPGNYAYYNIPHWSAFESLWYALENKRNFHVHNEWLEMAVESGAPGLAALLGLFAVSIVTFFNNPWLPAEPHRGFLMALPASMVAVGTDACFGFNLHAPVSAGLMFILLGLRPAHPYYSSPTRPLLRKGAVVMCILTLVAAWPLWRAYGHERLYQRAQGAVAWERAQEKAGTRMDTGAHTTTLLNDLTESWPQDYRGWMLQGDYALLHGQYSLAANAFEQALHRHPFLPGLHVQLARAQIRQAQENITLADSALAAAEAHAQLARERCPELADAWAMLGWCGYVRTTMLGQSDTRDEAILNFVRARALGLSDDSGIDAALGALYVGAEEWMEASGAFARSVQQMPGNLDRWTQWHNAATHAGWDALAAHRQALLAQLHQVAAGTSAVSPTLAAWMSGRITVLSQTPAAKTVAEAALRAALVKAPSLTGVWGAWLGVVEAGLRREKLSALLADLADGGTQEVSPVILTLETALKTTNTDSLAAATQAMADELATAPGMEDFALASVYTPLLDLLDDAMATSGLSDGLLGPAWRDLGAARFEVGDLSRADEHLRAAESALPVGTMAPAWYYHSRVLAALGQRDGALLMAKTALDADGALLEYQWQFARCLMAAGSGEASRFVYESLLATIPPDHPYRPLIEQESGALAAPEASP